MHRTTKSARPVAAVLLPGLFVGLAGCSAVAPDPGVIVQLQASWPAYDQTSLVREATLVVEGSVVATDFTILLPGDDGVTPGQNPLLGLSEAEKRAAIPDLTGVPSTLVTVRVDTVYRGDVRPGGEVTIVQTGGRLDDQLYSAAAEPLLEANRTYLLFAAGSLDGAYAVLGGSAGTYVGTAEGAYRAVNPDLAPFDRLTRGEVARLTR